MPTPSRETNFLPQHPSRVHLSLFSVYQLLILTTMSTGIWHSRKPKKMNEKGVKYKISLTSILASTSISIFSVHNYLTFPKHEGEGFSGSVNLKQTL